MSIYNNEDNKFKIKGRFFIQTLLEEISSLSESKFVPCQFFATKIAHSNSSFALLQKGIHHLRQKITKLKFRCTHQFKENQFVNKILISEDSTAEYYLVLQTHQTGEIFNQRWNMKKV